MIIKEMSHTVRILFPLFSMRTIFFGIVCACALALTTIDQTDAVKGLIGRVLGEV